jgi:hypothetical protein
MSTSTHSRNKIEEDSAAALTRKKTITIQNLAKFENTIKKAWVKHHQKLCHQEGEK